MTTSITLNLNIPSLQTYVKALSNQHIGLPQAKELMFYLTSFSDEDTHVTWLHDTQAPFVLLRSGDVTQLCDRLDGVITGWLHAESMKEVAGVVGDILLLLETLHETPASVSDILDQLVADLKDSPDRNKMCAAAHDLYWILAHIPK